MQVKSSHFYGGWCQECETYHHLPDTLAKPYALELINHLKVDGCLDYESDLVDREIDFETAGLFDDYGKMFGVLVVQKPDKSFGYLGTVSGTFPRNKTCERFVPSVFDEATDDFFINKGMTELTEMGKAIKMAAKPTEINKLTEARKQKSFALQQRLFENYEFTTAEGNKKKVLQIFTDSAHGNPPAAAGECAAPKLLQYAFSHQLTPIAIAEFWWGNPSKNKEREPLGFYPACKNKCRPILEFMLEDDVLFEITNT